MHKAHWISNCVTGLIVAVILYLALTNNPLIWLFAVAAFVSNLVSLGLLCWHRHVARRDSKRLAAGVQAAPGAAAAR